MTIGLWIVAAWFALGMLCVQVLCWVNEDEDDGVPPEAMLFAVLFAPIVTAIFLWAFGTGLVAMGCAYAVYRFEGVKHRVQFWLLRRRLDRFRSALPHALRGMTPRQFLWLRERSPGATVCLSCRCAFRSDVRPDDIVCCGRACRTLLEYRVTRAYEALKEGRSVRHALTVAKGTEAR